MKRWINQLGKGGPLLLLFLAGCAGTASLCDNGRWVGDRKRFTVTRHPDLPVHFELAGMIARKGAAIQIRGDMFFLPPDTFRLQLLSDFGNVLADIKAAGDSLSVWVQGERETPGTSALAGMSHRQWSLLKTLLAGCPGVMLFFPEGLPVPRCRKGRAVLSRGGREVVLAGAHGTIRTVQDIGAGMGLRISGYEQWEDRHWVTGFRLKDDSGGRLQLTVFERRRLSEKTGHGLLK